MLNRIFLFCTLLFSCNATLATLITLDSGSFVRSRAVGYAGPTGNQTDSITTTGVTSNTAVNTFASASTSASIGSNSSNAFIEMASSLTKTTSGRDVDSLMDVYFSVSSAVNYVASGSLTGITDDIEDRFRTKFVFVQFAGPFNFTENHEAFGSTNIDIDGIGSTVIGSTSGILGPGSYLVRMETDMIDFGNGLGDGTFTGSTRLDFSAISVSAPISFPLFLAGFFMLSLRFQKSRQRKGR